MKPGLPHTAKDVFRLPARDRLLYEALIALNRLTGRWEFPVTASGDLETMTLLDKVYWVYKAKYPVERAWRGSGLEEFFEREKAHRWALPEGFEPEQEATLSAVGDLMDHPFLATSRGSLYERVADRIFDADLSMANLECVVAPDATDDFIIDSRRSAALHYDLGKLDAAAGGDHHRFNLLATANNHSLDFGEQGVAQTLEAISERGMASHGMNGGEADARQATILERRGIRFGVVSHTFGLNARRPPPHMPWLVNRSDLNGLPESADLSLLDHQIGFCREREVDLVVAQLHWGMEHEYYPRPEQLRMAHRLAEMGVDVIIGHHPHVIQPVEAYRTRRDPQRVVPIYYSLGNLLTPFTHQAFRRSLVARVRVAKGRRSDGQVRTYVAEASGVELFQEIDDRRERLRLIEAAVR